MLQGHETAVTGNGGGGGGAASTGFRVGGGGYATGGGGDEPRRKRQDDNKPNHVLLFTIINPMYPITVVSSIINYYLIILGIILYEIRKLFFLISNIWIQTKFRY